MQVSIDTSSDGHIEDAAGSIAWATSYLEQVLRTPGTQKAGTSEAGTHETGSPESGAHISGVRIVVTSTGSELARQALHRSGLTAPQDPEAFALTTASEGSDLQVLVVAPAAQGAVYGLLEIADIVVHADDPAARLRDLTPSSQSPATPVRSILRPFTSITEDLAWLTDHDFWDAYLTELATQRLNRFQLAFGLQYNYGHNPVTDTYLCFPYPFLLDVPGYDVRAENVTPAERTRNLAILRYVSDEAKRRGIQFQLGLWNHAYDQTQGDFSYDNGINDPQFPIVGLTPQTHADYCGTALELLLRECPSITGLTLRVHYEGGVPDDVRTDFWRRTLEGVGRIGRTVEIDMHAKGVDEALIDTARATGQPVVLSTKYWAEHLGLPYHQASIREKERVPTVRPGGLRAITGFERSFTRYGYGDFLRDDRDFDVMFRIWHGGQRVLLWGDPKLAAGVGRFGSTFCGAVGVELFDPLSFKGRKGTGTAGQRDPYADPSLQLGGQEWRKYRYTHRLWGRLLYDPDAEPDGWQRFLGAEFGAAGPAIEEAVAAASRVVPLVTVTHAVGASISGYWPEMYIDMPIVDGPHVDHYAGDSGVTRFGAVSSFDPVLFASVDEYADPPCCRHHRRPLLAAGRGGLARIPCAGSRTCAGPSYRRGSRSEGTGVSPGVDRRDGTGTPGPVLRGQVPGGAEPCVVRTNPRPEAPGRSRRRIPGSTPRVRHGRPGDHGRLPGRPDVRLPAGGARPLGRPGAGGRPRPRRPRTPPRRGTQGLQHRRARSVRATGRAARHQAHEPRSTTPRRARSYGETTWTSS